MRVLGFDPGAARMGWAVIEKDRQDHLTWIDSGYVAIPRGDQDFQPYRLRVIQTWTTKGTDLLLEYRPDLVATETVPPVGAHSGGSIQMQLAATAITIVQCAAFIFDFAVKQISARTMQKAMAGKSPATKPKVRDGVISFLPVLQARKHLWTGKGAVFEEPDANGIALTALGLKV